MNSSLLGLGMGMYFVHNDRTISGLMSDEQLEIAAATVQMEEQSA